MTVPPSDVPAANSPTVQLALCQEIECVNALHRLAGRCLNPVLRLHTFRHYGDGDRLARDALLELQQAVNELPDLPMADDPFSADEIVEEANVTATSMHAAAFDMARRTWHSVQLTSLAPGTCSDHADAAGQPYTRITSPVMRQAPTEVPWSADVWKRVRQQLADAPPLDLERIQARLALERNRAVRHIETRFGVLLIGGGMIPSAVVAAQPAAPLPASPVGSQAVEHERAGTLTPPQLPPDDDLPFLPSELHERILAALQQKALTLDALAAKLQVERSALHRDGIKELKRRGLIDNNRRAGGYFRPDAPPPKYAEQLGRKPR
ncbi:MAG TPA: hypothetical protein VH643_13005 [Gemmataceae bacterium]|jgi:hypothetical protein